jgi:uncharacterized protein YacL
MNASRNRVKVQNRELNSQLQASEEAARKLREKRKVEGKVSEILLNTGGLVFGGVVIGVIFQDTKYQFLVMCLGMMTFIVLILLGLNMYKRSIKE